MPHMMHSPLSEIRHLRMDNAKHTGVLVDAGLAPPQERLRNRIR
jgi:hypothetical protein